MALVKIKTESLDGPRARARTHTQTRTNKTFVDGIAEQRGELLEPFLVHHFHPGLLVGLEEEVLVKFLHVHDDLEEIQEPITYTCSIHGLQQISFLWRVYTSFSKQSDSCR